MDFVVVARTSQGFSDRGFPDLIGEWQWDEVETRRFDLDLIFIELFFLWTGLDESRDE